MTAQPSLLPGASVPNSSFPVRGFLPVDATVIDAMGVGTIAVILSEKGSKPKSFSDRKTVRPARNRSFAAAPPRQGGQEEETQ
jgi:hypothetical protein